MQLLLGLLPSAGEAIVAIALVVAFIRIVLPVLARLAAREKPRRSPPRWLRVFFVGVVIVVLGGLAIMGVLFGPLPAAMGLSPFLGGAGGALLWGGSRRRRGTDQFCAKCGYPSHGAAGRARCPECGHDWARGRVLGRRSPDRRLIYCGVAALGAMGLLVVIAALAALRV